MVTIKREGTKVRVDVDPGMFDKLVMSCYWECNSDWYAELMVDRLRNQLSKTVQEIRAEEYARGWKEAKAKKHGPSNTFVGVFRKFWNS